MGSVRTVRSHVVKHTQWAYIWAVFDIFYTEDIYVQNMDMDNYRPQSHILVHRPSPSTYRPDTAPNSNSNPTSVALLVRMRAAAKFDCT